MSTIRDRLLRAFLSVIATLSLVSLFSFAFSFWTTAQYKSISETMIAEYQLVDNMATLIDAFNRRVQSAGAQSVAQREQQRIDTAQANIQRLTVFLDPQELDVQSRSDYLGFKASVEKFTTHINDGLQRFEKGSIENYFSDYNEANKQYGFVRENGTALIFSQLRHASEIRDTINRTYAVSIILGLVALVLLVVGCIFYVFRFSKQLTSPLNALISVAEKVAAGEVGMTIAQDLTRSSDEIGRLARSFEIMVHRLFENISKLDKSSKNLATHNEELARMNKLMVDRELKMIELKKENEQLRQKTGAGKDIPMS